MALVVVQSAKLAEQATLIEALRVQLAGLQRAAGRDSSNSSQPPSQDGPAAKATGTRAGADAEADAPQAAGAGPHGSGPDGSGLQGGGGKRKQGGQPGHRGSGLARVARPDATTVVEPEACQGCGASLAGADGSVASWVQVLDLPTLALTVTEYLMMKRVCRCGCATTAALPAGVPGGPVCYGPEVAAAVTWLASQDVIGIERAAEMMSQLLGVDVSTGYVSSCLARLDDALTAAGFEPELKAALCEAEVLGTDETPAPVTPCGAATEAGRTGQDISNPHVFTVRTMRSCTGGGPDLVWFGAAGTRTKKEITAFGILDNFTGTLVRDDFGGYLSYDDVLAGVQQCLSHILRYLQDTINTGPREQVWAERGRPFPAQRDPRPQHRPPQRHHRGHQRNHPAPHGLRPGSGLRDLDQPLPALADGQPPRPGPRETPVPQGKTGLAVHHPNRRAPHEQRLRGRHPRFQTGPEGIRLLAHPGHPPTPLPHPLLPRQRTQPRPPPPGRRPRRPQRHRLDATPQGHRLRTRCVTAQPATPDCLPDKLIRRGVHTSVAALEKDIQQWIDTWNEDPRPFTWVKTADDILNSLADYLAKIRVLEPNRNLRP